MWLVIRISLEDSRFGLRHNASQVKTFRVPQMSETNEIWKMAKGGDGG
jgi:hypothetical protein